MLGEKLFVTIWVAILTLVGVLAMLAIIGAWDPGTTPGLAIGACAALALILVYTLIQRALNRRTPDHELDPRVVQHRERRGF